MELECLRNPNFDIVFTYPNSTDKIDFLTYSCISINENQINDGKTCIVANFYLADNNVEFFFDEPCGKELDINFVFYNQREEMIFCTEKKSYKIITTDLDLDVRVSGIIIIKVIFEEILN